MESFSDDALYRLLTEHDRDAASLAKTDDDALRLYIRLADGSFGRASRYVHAQKKELKTDAAYDAHEGAAQVLDILFSDVMTDDSPVLSSGRAGAVRPTRTALMTYISDRIDAKREGAEARERLRALIDALCMALRDLSMCACGVRGHLQFYPTETQPMALSERCSKKTLSDTFRALSELRAQLSANPNVGMLLGTVSGILLGLRT